MKWNCAIPWVQTEQNTRLVHKIHDINYTLSIQDRSALMSILVEYPLIKKYGLNAVLEHFLLDIKWLTNVPPILSNFNFCQYDILFSGS